MPEAEFSLELFDDGFGLGDRFGCGGRVAGQVVAQGSDALKDTLAFVAETFLAVAAIFETGGYALCEIGLVRLRTTTFTE